MKKILSASFIAILYLLPSNRASGQSFTTVSNVALANPDIDMIEFNTVNSNIRGIRGKTHDYFQIFSHLDHENGPSLFMFSHGTTNPAFFKKRGGISLWSTFMQGYSQDDDMAFEVLSHPIQFLGGSIGSPTPLFTIIKDGDIILKNNSDPSNVNAIKGNSDVSGMALYANTSWSNGAGILLRGKSSNHGNIDFVVPEDASGTEEAYNFWTADANGDWTNNLVSIHKNGKVRIGAGDININTTNDYKLYVQTGILTEKVKVALSDDPTNWSDFVFNDDYELRTLNEVEQYIKENKHLPEIPSTAEVHANGLDLAQMDAKLLQKIEELTLYIIQQQKEINKLKSKLNN